jgi:hypothetical protein
MDGTMKQKFIFDSNLYEKYYVGEKLDSVVNVSETTVIKSGHLRDIFAVNFRKWLLRTVLKIMNIDNSSTIQISEQIPTKTISFYFLSSENISFKSFLITYAFCCIREAKLLSITSLSSKNNGMKLPVLSILTNFIKTESKFFTFEVNQQKPELSLPFGSTIYTCWTSDILTKVNI